MAGSPPKDWWNDAGLRKLNFLLLGVMLGSVGFGFDASLISSQLSNKRWVSDLGVSSSSIEGAITASSSFGAVAALIPAAYVSDLIGRRYTIVISNIAIIGVVIGQSFCHNAASYLGTRIVVGFFDIIVTVSSNTLVAELSHPHQRAQATALYNTFFYIGGITAAWSAYGSLSINSSFSWRIPVLLQVLWPAVQTIMVFFCPESPRWLMTKGREEEAREILNKYHANGRVFDEVVELEYQEAMASLEAEKHEASYSSWKALFTTRGNLMRSFLVIFLGLSSQWVGNGIVSYYFTPILGTLGISSSSQQQGINGGLQIWNWVASIIGALLAERLGRKMLMLLSVAGMLIFMILVTACSAVYAESGNAASGRAVIVFLFLFFGFYDIGYTPIPPLYVTEIASTHLRAKYNSLYWWCTAVALCFNQYVNPIAEDAIHWKYYIVYIVVLVVAFIVISLIAPETKGRNLEEVAAMFDNEIADNLARVSALKEDTKEEQVAEHTEFA
jgi:sugar porter (SP) family MFS transporter